MRKVITINLNNNAYQIDEDGYEALHAYLESAARRLSANPDRAEILVDLEQAIGDKCRACLGPHKSVVSSAEILRILEEMGPVEATAPDAPDASLGAAAAASTGAPGAKRLYRLADGSMWAGVCNGLAAYLGIDVVWMRLIFIALTVCTGVWLIVYIALIFIMPRAETAEQVAAAHGAAFNAREVVARLKKNMRDSGAALRG